MEGQLCSSISCVLFFTKVIAVCKVGDFNLIIWGSDKVIVQEIS